MTRILRFVALSALLGAPVTGAGSPPVSSRLPFIEDDYPRALSEARSKKVPIFLEAWAPW
jgi:hypothetical protein